MSKATGTRSAPRVLLIGIDGLFNYGGEAIVRGTVRMLREQWPSCTITHASRQPEADTARLSDLNDISVVQSAQRWTAKRVIRGLARRLGVGHGSPLPLKKSLVGDHDVILSIGGDNYAFMSADHRIHHNTLSLVDVGEYAMKKNRLFVIWGASIGPFDALPEIRDFFADHLRRVSLITAREQETFHYLGELGCSNHVLVADPAFLMEPPRSSYPLSKEPGTLAVAVNFSPASLAHLFGTEDHELLARKDLLAACVRGLLANQKVRLVFVPHVVPQGEPMNDDYLLLSDLIQLLEDRKDRITLLPRNLGGPGTKAILAQCDAVVAARMHCGVAAVSSGVPTLFLQYSRKASGMAQYVYGTGEWCLDIANMTPDTFGEKVFSMLDKREEVARHLRGQKERWMADARRGIEAVSTVTH